MCVWAAPVRADEATAASIRTLAAKRAAASLTNGGLSSGLPTSGAGRNVTGFANGFLYYPGAGGPQPGLNIGGRVPVGKSHVYVPYYGNVSGDPAHPTVQGTTGIAYGFRTWDISVLNGGIGTSQQSLPGTDSSKINPNLSLSVRF